jgi:hypothetical protein
MPLKPTTATAPPSELALKPVIVMSYSDSEAGESTEEVSTRINLEGGDGYVYEGDYFSFYIKRLTWIFSLKI